MSWNKLYSLKSYVRASLWIIPFFALIAQQAFFRAVLSSEEWIRWIPA